LNPSITSTPVLHAYRFGVPPDFLDAQNDSAIETGLIIPVLGDCKPPNNGPSMLKNAGHTELDDFFWFRDVKGADQHRGLGVDGFQLSYSDCDRGGLLDAKQGVIFVR